ncbi:MAG: DUF3105 domain-containing protein [Actinomycetota bacterium]|nr:DUF3105 domain-containing protein [Actinomycetota bacterium]
MAKKKKRRPSTAGRSGGTGTATKRPRSRTEETPSVKPAPAESGGPNRLARKEEARRQRERIRRQMARRRMLRRAGRWGVGALIVGGIVGGVFFLNRPRELNAEQRAVVQRAQTAAQAAGCTGITRVDPYPGNADQTHIGAAEAPQPPPLSSYPNTPPTSGPHLSGAQPAGVYPEPPDVYAVLHSLEHGAAVIWYDPRAERNPEIQQIKDFYGDPANGNKVIVAPYNFPEQGAAGRLPEGKQMALTAWHHQQSCDRPSLDVARGFVLQYAATGRGAYRGDAPEAGAPI